MVCTPRVCNLDTETYIIVSPNTNLTAHTMSNTPLPCPFLNIAPSASAAPQHTEARKLDESKKSTEYLYQPNSYIVIFSEMPPPTNFWGGGR